MNFTKFVPWVLGAIIALGSYFTGAVTAPEAFLLALDKEAQKAECVKLLEGEVE